MIIAHVIDSAGLYGAEAVVLALAAEQRAHGHQPVLISIGTPGSGEKAVEREASRLGIRVRALRMRAGLNPLGLRRLVLAITRERVEVVHSHGYKGDILLGLLPRSVLGAPLVCTVHGYTASHGLSRRAFYARLDKLVLRRVDAVALVHGRQRHELGHLGVAAACHVIENGLAAAPLVRPSPDAVAAVARLCQPGPAVGYVGRLSPEKGLVHLLEAARRLRDRDVAFRLVLVGDGPQRPALERLVHEWRLEDTVGFSGFVAGAAGCLASFDVFALPSLTEGLPITLLEAMSNGLAVVATRVGGVPALLEGRAGITVPPGASGQLAAAIEGLLRDPGQRQRLGESARSAVSAYSASRMAERYLALYREVVATRERHSGRHLAVAASR